MPSSPLKRGDPQCQDCFYRVLLKVPVVGRSGLRAPSRLPCEVEGNEAARGEGEAAALIFLQVFFWDPAAELSV